MSLFADFVGGFASTMLDERKVALAEKLRKEEEERRELRQIKRDMQQQDFQMHIRGVDAEAQKLRDERQAEERAEERAMRQGQFETTEARLAEAQRLAAEDRAETRALSRQAQGLRETGLMSDLLARGQMLDKFGKITRDTSFVASQPSDRDLIPLSRMDAVNKNLDEARDHAVGSNDQELQQAFLAYEAAVDSGIESAIQAARMKYERILRKNKDRPGVGTTDAVYQNK